MGHNRFEAARLMSMKGADIAEVYEVADGTLVVTQEGAQTLIDDAGQCTPVFPRRLLSGGPVQAGAPVELDGAEGEDEGAGDAGGDEDQGDAGESQEAAAAPAKKATGAKAKA